MPHKYHIYIYTSYIIYTYIMGVAYISVYAMSYLPFLLLLWAAQLYSIQMTMICYILLLITKRERYCWYHYEFLYWLLQVWLCDTSHGFTFIIFDFVKCITGGNMVLHINDKHGLYYHMDVLSFILFGLNIWLPSS